MQDKNKQVLLGCDGLVLKRLTEDHLEQIRLIRNSSYVQDRFIYRKEISKEEQVSWYNNNVSKGQCEYFSVYLYNEIIGLIYIQNIDKKTKEGEAGIFFKEDIPPSLYSFQASILMLDYYFTKYENYTLRAQVLEKNRTALKYNKSLGFELKDKISKIINSRSEIICNLVLKYYDYYDTTKKIRKIIFG